jgi:S1-C subfamily serine protease
MGSIDEEPRVDTATRVRRILPKTVLGLAGMLFLMSLAAAFSGAVLYAYYESRQEKTTNRVEDFFRDYSKSIDDATKAIQAEGERAKQDIRTQLDELQKFAASGETLTGLLTKAAPSVYFVSTVDQAGAPSVGTAFVAFSDGQQSFLITSFTTIRAATVTPGPEIVLRKQGQDDMTATPFTWDENRDIALLVVDRANLPALPWAATDAPPRIGDRLFAISGLGSTGASITQGFVADVSQDGIEHDVAVGAQFQGSPLINSNGEVVGIASRTYGPLGFTPVDVYFAPLVRMACEHLVSCPEGGGQPGG